MGMLSRFGSLFLDRPSRNPPGFEPEAVEADSPEMAAESSDRQAGISGIRIGIVYSDAAGRQSDRIVRVRRIYESQDTAYMNAHCELRDALRTFRLDRILEVIDYRTGEIHDDVEQFFAPLIGFTQSQSPTIPCKPSATEQVISACTDGLCVLLYFADANGELKKSERRVINRYIEWRTQNYALPERYSKAYLGRYMNNTVPETEDFEAALVRLLEDKDGRVVKVVEAARDLVMADGEVDEEEKARLAALVQIVEERR